jgi:hypothetical protein
MLYTHILNILQAVNSTQHNYSTCELFTVIAQSKVPDNFSTKKLIFHIKGRSQIEGILEQGVEQNIWTITVGSNRRMKKTA